MKKLFTTFLKDAKLSLNSLYFYIEIGMAVIFIAVMLFVVPENFDQSQQLFAFINLDEPAKSQIMELVEAESVEILSERSQVEEALSKDRSAVGVEIKTDGNVLAYDLILQGYESESMKAMLKASIEGEFLSQIPGFTSAVSTSTLDENPQRLSDRVNVLPIYLTINVGLMGLFIIAAYIFLDKDEGVIKAYAVAPVKLWQYLASKMLIMLMMGLVTSIMTVLAIAGTGVNFLQLFLLVVSFNLFGSALGLFISSFFDTMVKAMGGLYAGMMLLVLPVVSYFMPSFNPLWIRVFPSYPMMFSFRELLLEGGNARYIYTQAGLFLVLGLIVFVAANIRFKKSLTV
ncbi:ABC transporter permease [Alkalibacter saccharofermentans]|uniref:ABC-2 family transporter protein n=1 Tax=Alkalibacter saccharofermentans DSM 14828 TaxID=1120975 RepID=A0A1M4SJ59_9FIRM|nr:ABC transporter permease [Alkalibacter saccharofermentans]SHE32241.1 ABC-2 family transporter protein [Alkalibacter saccharofermentans DSM 14828]